MAEKASPSSMKETQPVEAPLRSPPGEEPRVWTTEELLGRDREVLIQHGEDIYRLRITRRGKLILYK